MRELSKYLFIFCISIFIASCSSNPADDMEPGVNYVHYDDGSCTERSNRKCISKEELNNICQSSNEFGVTVFVSTGYGTEPAFKALAKANGVKTTVKVIDNLCGVVMETAGIYRGTQYNIKKICSVWVVKKSKSSGDIVVSETSSVQCIYRGL